MSREIADKITLLGKQLNRFLSISGGSINLMFFLPKQHMFLTFLESEEQSKIEDEDRSQFEQGDYNLRKKQDLKLTALMLYV